MPNLVGLLTKGERHVPFAKRLYVDLLSNA
jgi:hypothetical protein